MLKPAHNSTSQYWEISRTSAGLNYTYKNNNPQNILFMGNDGLIGVGNTNPAATLDVSGSFKTQNADITGTLTTQKFDVRDTLSANILKAQSATIAGTLSANSLNARTASISDNAIINGCVGIGTSNPAALFHINDTRVFLPDRTPIEDSASSRYTRTLLQLTTPESGYGFSISYDYGSLTFQQRSGDFNLNTPGGGLTIASNGNVGVGNYSPQAKLVVDGLLKAANADIAGTLSASTLNAENATITNATITNTLNANSANINGKIKTKEVEVTLQGWKDYVFEEDYKLLPLVEVAQFIAENKHLPDVPSAAEVEANGINLGEMNAILIQKVEELTLYILDLQKQINELKTK